MRLAAPDGAYARLRRQIVRGELAPGARVSEDELADRLGLSRTPVREAMRRLQLEGLLVLDGGGARPRVAVAPLHADEARELYAATGALEGMAARGVAALAPTERSELADRLQALDDTFARATQTEPLAADELYALHHAFHERLADACAGPVVHALLASLRPRLERYEWTHAPALRRVGAGFETMHAEHGAIVAAVRAGGADALERAVRENWTNAAERLAAALDAADALAAPAPPPVDARAAGSVTALAGPDDVDARPAATQRLAATAPVRG